MKKILFIWLLMLSLCFEAKAQSFDATVNRNQLPSGETLVLTLELKDVDTSQAPDVKALSKDFTVMSVSNGYRTNIINGNVNKSRQWNLVLIPNHTGDITIPSIELAGYQTQPITIKVTDGSDVFAQKNKADDTSSNSFKITGEIDNHHPFVQQQINYELKIYDTGGLRGDAPLFVGGGDDWIIKIFGEPEVKTQIVNGQNLREITYRYALFPQKSGNLTIPSVRFNGYYLTKTSRRDPFARFFDDDFFAGFGINDVFSSSKNVVLATRPMSVEVKPAAITDGWWLPSSQVELSAEFDDAKPIFKVGEPVSRTITLKAYGVLDSQLPDIKFASIENIKQYPEKPVRSSHVENGRIVSVAQIRNVYIPQATGEIELPEVKVNWFNTAKNSIEIATLPAYKAYIVQGDTKATTTQSSIQPAEDIVGTSSAPMPTITQAGLDNRQIIWLLLGAFVGGIILTAAMFKLFTLLQNKSNKSAHYKEVIAYARSGDIKHLRDELLLWGQNKFSHADITSLHDLAHLIDDKDFTLQTDKIREYLYAISPASWHGAEFISVFERIAKFKYKKALKEDSVLPKLYK